VTESQKRKQKKYENMLRRAGVEVDDQKGIKEISNVASVCKF